MDSSTVYLLAALVFLVAVLYASVGHGGGSGYLAAMALLGVAPVLMKPTALALNVLVATIATVTYYRAGYFSWPVFWPFALLSIPCAFIGGSLVLPGLVYRPVVGLVLLFAAYRLAFRKPHGAQEQTRSIPTGMALVVGAGLGLLSGLTGVGGGIFLSPLLLLLGWTTPRTTSGVAAAFILVNSVAGLLGHVAFVAAPPRALPVLAIAAAAGGWIGAEIGSRRIAPHVILRLLAMVLVVAGLKLILAPN